MILLNCGSVFFTSVLCLNVNFLFRSLAVLLLSLGDVFLRLGDVFLSCGSVLLRLGDVFLSLDSMLFVLDSILLMLTDKHMHICVPIIFWVLLVLLTNKRTNILCRR